MAGQTVEPLHHIFAQAPHCVQADDPIRRIAVVGTSAADPDYPDWGEESKRLRATLRYLKDSGIPVSPDYSLAFYDLPHANFLRSRDGHDMIFISYILKEKTSFAREFDPEGDPKMPRAEWERMRNYTLALGHDPSNWLRRARKAGAKVVATFGGNRELASQDFAGAAKSPYTQVLPTPAFEMAGRTLSYNLENLYGPGADTPLPWLGVCIDQGYLKKVRNSLSPATQMGRRARIAVGMDDPAYRPPS